MPVIYITKLQYLVNEALQGVVRTYMKLKPAFLSQSAIYGF